jgi:predicted GTPase
MGELEETIRNVDCDLVLIATPVDLTRIIEIRQPTCRARYEVQEIGTPTLREVLHKFVAGLK